jgi:hypothetical protein
MILLGLRAKLTFAIALLIVAFAGFFVLYFPAQQAHVANEALRSRAESIARSFQSIGTGWLGELPMPLGKVLAQFAEDGSSEALITYLVVWEPGRDRPSHRYGREDIPPDLAARFLSEMPHTEQTNAYIQISEPLLSASGRHLGTITIGLSRDSVHVARAQSRITALVVSAVILLVGIAVAWLVGGGIATPILSAAQELDAVSGSLLGAARDQEASAAQEAAAVAETRRSMETLLDSAQQIADRSSEVLGNAERSTNGSQHIAQRIGTLNELSEKVAEILGVIMQVADKADLLALNASLEGTRAGEAGKGFALVAAEMRRLAENVVESVAGIRELMKDMRDASQAAVSASQEGTRSSTATTHSAREIALLTQEQRQATEQVMASMDEMGDILNHTLDGIQRTTTSASQLTELASKLSRMVNPTPARRRAEDKHPGSSGAV